MNNKKRKHVELFAGCGGMAIGMEEAKFELEFANEVSPMAANTFAFNVLGVSIENQTDKVQWLHTRHKKKDYSARLRENLLSHNKIENTEVKFNKSLEDLKNKILVGDVRNLKKLLLKNNIKDPYLGKLDLISGGPPCQSFSLAGRREQENYKNRLPLDYAEICKILNPKVVLLENVKGILSAFQLDGKKFYAWLEVAKAFAIKGYAPVCMLLNTKYFGIAQNRPRYIMMGLRLDIFTKLQNLYPDNTILINIHDFLIKLKRYPTKITPEDLNYYDIERDTDLFNGVILPKPSTFEKKDWISVKDAIGDLKLVKPEKPSQYALRINSHNNFPIQIKHFNHDVRLHTTEIRNRFRFYQILNYCPLTKTELIESVKLKNGVENNILKNSYKEFKLNYPEGNQAFSNFNEWKKFIQSIKYTKKHSQRALVEHLPSPAQLTIPDDTCHYSIDEPRVLTVREIARIQSFPDNFIFKSKITTGGKNRNFEVPQYTQVGNAVPPRLAYFLGMHVDGLLRKVDD